MDVFQQRRDVALTTSGKGLTGYRLEDRLEPIELFSGRTELRLSNCDSTRTTTRLMSDSRDSDLRTMRS
jgi:hypothetical protein